jgi:hypothetical protein
MGPSGEHSRPFKASGKGLKIWALISSQTLRRGKLKNIAITAVAREFVGFIWAVAQAVGAAPPAAANIKAPAVAS